MPLSTYAELQTYIAGDLNRSDLTTAIIDFIRMTETEMSERLKCREMDVRATLTVTDGEADIPAAMQSIRAMRLATTPFTRIVPEGLEALEGRDPAQSGGQPTYALTAEKIVFWPVTSTTVRVTYRRDVPALSTGVNWVLTEHPHLYIYGTLWQAHMYLKDDARASQYMNLFAGAITSLNERDVVSQISGAQMSPNGPVV
ncbi:hypothetical protein UFOVP399_40 [uncultured Caudovirales phage]|uniref:Uncharacterized protein n=1 Tax=uncultured Caudovirales phage TaxID=2100421 RepID=A0A6J5M2L0_9CAUD|nr:hypothetical protein UFOVP399_40 [uncultured Caudovirales phage]